MRDLYARFILFLIRPALERHEAETYQSRKRESQEAVFDGLVGPGSKRGLLDTAMRSAYDLERS